MDDHGACLAEQFASDGCGSAIPRSGELPGWAVAEQHRRDLILILGDLDTIDGEELAQQDMDLADVIKEVRDNVETQLSVLSGGTFRPH
jgi:hypothetical protein